MTTLAELNTERRQTIYATGEIASARARALEVLALAGVEDTQEILDTALELENLAGWQAGQERLEHARAAIDTVVALYTTDHTPVDQPRPDPISVSLRQIDRDDRVQIRVLGTDTDLVAQYADAMRAGDEFPPLVCFFDRAERALWLADGFHRAQAAQAAGRASFSCLVHAGTHHHAAEYAATCNARHGLPMTGADKREAVKRLLHLHPDWSSRQIARLVGSSHNTVEKTRKDLEALHAASGQIDQIQPEPRTVQRGHQTYTYTSPERPDHAPVWQLERAIRQFLDAHFGATGQADSDPRPRIQLLETIRAHHDRIPPDLAQALPQPYLQRDLTQALNDVLDQIRRQPYQPGSPPAVRRLLDFFRSHSALRAPTAEAPGWAHLPFGRGGISYKPCVGCGRSLDGLKGEPLRLGYYAYHHADPSTSTPRFSYACPLCWLAADLPAPEDADRHPTAPPPPPPDRAVVWSPEPSSPTVPLRESDRLRQLLLTANWQELRVALIVAGPDDLLHALHAIFSGDAVPLRPRQDAARCLVDAILQPWPADAPPAPSPDQACPHCGGDLIRRSNGTVEPRLVCQDCGALLEEQEASRWPSRR